MSSELSFFEQIGGTYTEKDGLLYPNLLSEQETEHIDVGKYGLQRRKCMRQSFTDFTREDLGREIPARNGNYNKDFTVGTGAKESEQCEKEIFHTQICACGSKFADSEKERNNRMRETIREYNMNGSMIIGIDNGYGNTKTARTCFKTAIMKCDFKPVFSRNFIEDWKRLL